jgi:hypothetical protein
MNRKPDPKLHEIAASLLDAADFLHSQTELSSIILNERRHLQELLHFAQCACRQAKAIRLRIRVLQTHRGAA